MSETCLSVQLTLRFDYVYLMYVYFILQACGVLTPLTGHRWLFL